MQKEYKLTIQSPYGKQPLEDFKHFMGKVSDDAETRWGIELEMEAIADEPDVSEDFE